MSHMLILEISDNDLGNIIVALNAMIETPGRCNWDEKRELLHLGDRLLFQSQNQPQGEQENAMPDVDSVDTDSVPDGKQPITDSRQRRKANGVRH